MTHFIYSVLRARVLRAIFSIIFIFKSLNEIFEISSLFFSFYFFIKRLYSRLRDYFGFIICFFASFSRVTFNIFIILYTVISFNFIRFPLIYFLYTCRSLFYIFNYCAINAIIAFYILYITVMRSI